MAPCRGNTLPRRDALRWHEPVSDDAGVAEASPVRTWTRLRARGHCWTVDSVTAGRSPGRLHDQAVRPSWLSTSPGLSRNCGLDYRQVWGGGNDQGAVRDSYGGGHCRLSQVEPGSAARNGRRTGRSGTRTRRTVHDRGAQEGGLEEVTVVLDVSGPVGTESSRNGHDVQRCWSGRRFAVIFTG